MRLTAAFSVALACLVGAGLIGIYFLAQMFYLLILYGAFLALAVGAYFSLVGSTSFSLLKLWG